MGHLSSSIGTVDDMVIMPEVESPRGASEVSGSRHSKRYRRAPLRSCQHGVTKRGAEEVAVAARGGGDERTGKRAILRTGQNEINCISEVRAFRVSIAQCILRPDLAAPT